MRATPLGIGGFLRLGELEAARRLAPPGRGRRPDCDIVLGVRPRALVRGLPLLVALAGIGGARGADEGIEIAYLNRTWTDLEGELDPVREGPLSVRLRSPQQRVTVHHNRLVLAAVRPGETDARVEARFEGEGQLVADVEGGPFATTLTDRVRAPLQSVLVKGRVSITRDADAYQVRFVDGRTSAPVKIESRLAGEVVALCGDLGGLAVVDCNRLRESLSTVQVPLAGGDRALRLPRESLGAQERAYLDRFVARDRSTPPASKSVPHS
jgi:hypothetical protein